MELQIFCGWSTHKGVQEQRSQRNPLPQIPTHGSLLHIMGSRRLGYKGWDRKDRLEQSPFLCLHEELRARRLPHAGALNLPVQPLKLVGGSCLSTAQRRPSKKLPLGSHEPLDLRLLHRQISIPSDSTWMFGRDLNIHSTAARRSTVTNIYV